jgi:hypothetical protein
MYLTPISRRFLRSLSMQNVPSVLADPTLDLADVNGNVIASNDR